MSDPLISVITPSFNQGPFIEETIQSVLSQDYPHIEYLVIDGGSTDNTIEILRTFEGRLTWVSEPDNGQADAINKGFRRAQGHILCWLNSDDLYLPKSLSKVAAYFVNHPEVSMIYGGGHLVDREGKFIVRFPLEPFDLGHLAEQCYIFQPAVFFRKEVFDAVGPLNSDLHYCMDYDYWIRIGKHLGGGIGTIFDPLAEARYYPEAKTISKREEGLEEIMATVLRHYGYVPFGWGRAYFTQLLFGRRITRRHLSGKVYDFKKNAEIHGVSDLARRCYAIVTSVLFKGKGDQFNGLGMASVKLIKRIKQ